MPCGANSRAAFLFSPYCCRLPPTSQNPLGHLDFPSFCSQRAPPSNVLSLPGLSIQAPPQSASSTPPYSVSRFWVSPAFAALDPCLCPGPSSILPGLSPPAAVESCLLPTRGLCEGKDDLSFQIGLPEGRVGVSLFSWGASPGPTRTSSQEHPPHFPWLVGLTLAGDLLPSSWASAQRAVSADSQWDPGIPQVDD